MKSIITMLLVMVTTSLVAQQEDLTYLSSGGKLKPLQAIMDIRHYDVTLDVDIANKTIQGNTLVTMNLSTSTDTILLDLVHLLKVNKILVNKKAVSFEQKDDKIYIHSSTGFKAGKQMVDIHYGGVPPVAVKPPWLGGFTWAKDSSGNDWVSINIQKEGGRMYFPCKDHPSDEPNEGVDMRITVPKGLVVAGPGLLQKTTHQKNKSTYHWKTNYTISNYCVLFNIGKYKVVKDSYTTINGNVVPVEFYVLEEDTMHAKKLIATKIRDSKILEKYFGEYPWYKEKIGIAEVPNSGMEHQTMITFNNKFEYRRIGNEDYSDNLFHEYAHEWWANKVTNKDWAHMWIQEGIGTYAEALTHYDLGGQEAYDKIIASWKRGIKYKKPMVGGEELSEDETYAGNDIYTKGAFFMHSLRYVIGDDLFFPTIKKLSTDPKYTYDNFVTSKDVEELFSGAAGYSLKPFFDFYLRTTKTIEMNVKENGYRTYVIKPTNYFMDLPLDIMINGKIEKIKLTKEGLTVTSNTTPILDPNGFYLKTVTLQ
jgi:aminopeptidase N